MGDFWLQEATLSEIQAEMTAGSLTARSLITQSLDQIKQYGTQLNALIAIHLHCLRDADLRDKERFHKGPRGPLHGVPVILKDNIDLAGMPTTGGALALQQSIPTADAFIVKKLRTAGAIILAKANLHELAWAGTTVSSLGGRTYNPYDLTRTPGGSSGGTGAAIAAGFGVVGIGTDTFNSVRSPASACNLVGLRPTLGLVSRTGILPVALTQDTAGPMTRTVTDAALVLDAISGPDPQDAATAASQGKLPRSYAAQLTSTDLTGCRLGVLRSCFGTGSDFEPVNHLMHQALKDLTSLGAELVELSLPLNVEDLIAKANVQPWETKTHLNAYFAQLGATAPIRTLDEFIAADLYHSSLRDGLLLAQRMQQEDPEYQERLQVRRPQLRHTLQDALTAHQLDALVYPHQKRLVAKVGEPQRDRNGFLAAGSGLPAIAVPAGFAPKGIPVGLEFLGGQFEEARLLKLAYAYEQHTCHRRSPPLSEQVIPIEQN